MHEKKEELKRQVAELTDRLKQQQNATPTADDQMALLEKSYELVNVISTENANMLKTVKGIGLKTAQRVIVDLKDKIKTMGMSAAGGASAGLLLQPANAEVQEEAVSALTMLGFAAAPSQKVVLAILKEEPDAPVEKVIKLALKRL